jgi:hypothetical protein
MKKRVISICLFSCLLVPVLAQGQAEVSYTGGLLTVRCNEIPLSQVFEQIQTQTAMELILEDSIKATRLTANLEAQPVYLALERLLEGSGVNYAMSFDPQDWTRVTKIFIGSGGESPSPPSAPQANSSRRPTRRLPARRAQPADEFEDEADMLEDEELEDFPDEFDPGEGFEPPEMEGGESPSFGTRPPSYPRSPFTPGIESNPFNPNPQQDRPRAEPQEEDPSDPPPAYYPFLDPFGRPIPVPPGTQQQRPKKKNPQNL